MTAKNRWPHTKPFYILWCPDVEKPSKVLFPTKEHAERVGRQMAQKYGKAFFLMQAVQCIELPPPPTFKITEYED
jgi:hypothetical protein